MLEPRCLDCGYILRGLDSTNCPECGRAFNLKLPSTYATKPPFHRWRFWLPAFLTATGCAVIFFPCLIFFAGFGWTVSIVLPLCLGVFIGYGCRVATFQKYLLAVCVLGIAVLWLYSQNMVGVFCGMVLAMVIFGPFVIGTAAGAVLRTSLKQSKWDQRWHLPTLIILIVPWIAGTIEAIYRQPYPDETVSTSVVIPVPTDRAWHAEMFYEEVRGTPPLLMRFALPRPLYTAGTVESVGDFKVCVYSKGRLVKRITQRVPDQLLAFDVVEQTKIENHSVVLKGGSFQFSSLSADQTRVTLSTTYQPLLGPRFAWRWAEKIGIHTLHRYVLNGMRLKAISDDATSNAPALTQRAGPAL